jgi:Zn finger protein HypA/HybF involved in hydrogenase expression
MHEWSIVEETVKEILNQARKEGIEKIKKVRLSVGEDLEKESVEFCFKCIAKGDIFEKSELETQEMRGTGIVIERIEGA